jgi:hypothetical protein
MSFKDGETCLFGVVDSVKIRATIFFGEGNVFAKAKVRLRFLGDLDGDLVSCQIGGRPPIQSDFEILIGSVQLRPRKIIA